MSHINEKLGIRPAGNRSMMKLPADKTRRVQVTSAVCPACGRRGATESRATPGALFCTWCNHLWFVSPIETR